MLRLTTLSLTILKPLLCVWAVCLRMFDSINSRKIIERDGEFACTLYVWRHNFHNNLHRSVPTKMFIINPSSLFFKLMQFKSVLTLLCDSYKDLPTSVTSRVAFLNLDFPFLSQKLAFLFYSILFYLFYAFLFCLVTIFWALW